MLVLMLLRHSKETFDSQFPEKHVLRKITGRNRFLHLAGCSFFSPSFPCVSQLPGEKRQAALPLHGQHKACIALLILLVQTQGLQSVGQHHMVANALSRMAEAAFCHTGLCGRLLAWYYLLQSLYLCNLLLSLNMWLLM